MLQPHSTWQCHQKRDDDFSPGCTRAADIHSHSILPGTRHNPSWGGLKGLWKSPVNHLSLHSSYFHLPKTGTKQQGSVLLRKYHTLVKNGSFRLPSIISNSGSALSLLNSLIPMKLKASNTLSECNFASSSFTDPVVDRLQDEVCLVAISDHSPLCSGPEPRSWNWTCSLHWATTLWL